MLSNCKLHTTELGALRIKKNLGIDVDDVVAWCEKRIKECEVIKQGKNYYAIDDNYIFTINSYSYGIITAHLNCLLSVNGNKSMVNSILINHCKNTNPDVRIDYTFNNTKGSIIYEVNDFKGYGDSSYVSDLDSDMLDFHMIYGELWDTPHNGIITTTFKNRIGNYVYTVINLDGNYKAKFKGYIKIKENNR